MGEITSTHTYWNGGDDNVVFNEVRFRYLSIVLVTVANSDLGKVEVRADSDNPHAHTDTRESVSLSNYERMRDVCRKLLDRASDIQGK